MTAFVGRKLTLKWNNTTILGVRQRTIAIAGAPIDITDDDSAGWQTLISSDAAQYDLKITLAGVTKDAVLKNDWFTANYERQVVITYPDGHTITGNFFLAAYSDTGSYKDAFTWTAELMSDGAVAWV